jgi:hypothetical protein
VTDLSVEVCIVSFSHVIIDLLLHESAIKAKCRRIL